MKHNLINSFVFFLHFYHNSIVDFGTYDFFYNYVIGTKYLPIL